MTVTIVFSSGVTATLTVDGWVSAVDVLADELNSTYPLDWEQITPDDPRPMLRIATEAADAFLAVVGAITDEPEHVVDRVY